MRRRGCVAALALSWLAVSLASAAGEEGVLTRYRLAETRRSETPRGASTRGIDGIVHVAAENARLELSSGNFPGTVASLALADRSGLVLLDTERKTAARLSEAEFGTLLRGGREREEEGGAAFSYRDVEARVEPAGAGAPHPAGPTRRFAVRLSYALRVSTPGRVATLRGTTRGRLEAIDRARVARSPFEDLARLVTARGAAREALLRELSAVDGFVVFARLETEAEQSVETFPAPGGGTPTDAGAPLRSTTTVERRVSEVADVPRTRESAALFSLAEGVRVLGLERLLREPGGLP